MFGTKNLTLLLGALFASAFIFPDSFAVSMMDDSIPKQNTDVYTPGGAVAAPGGGGVSTPRPSGVGGGSTPGSISTTNVPSPIYTQEITKSPGEFTTTRLQGGTRTGTITRQTPASGGVGITEQQITTVPYKDIRLAPSGSRKGAVPGYQVTRTTERVTTVRTRFERGRGGRVEKFTPQAKVRYIKTGRMGRAR